MKEKRQKKKEVKKDVRTNGGLDILLCCGPGGVRLGVGSRGKAAGFVPPGGSCCDWTASSRSRRSSIQGRRSLETLSTSIISRTFLPLLTAGDGYSRRCCTPPPPSCALLDLSQVEASPLLSSAWLLRLQKA